MQELTSEMVRIEADAAASAEEKQQLRREYEAKLAAVAGLQQQMKQQVGNERTVQLRLFWCPAIWLPTKCVVPVIHVDWGRVLFVQDGARVEKERQRASSRVQQLQAELSSMRCQQDTLRQRLQERLTAQEKDAAAKAHELSSLRRAGAR
jgi:hypothetical protein